MNQKRLEERRRRKKRQLLIRKLTKLGIYAAAAVLLVVFVIRGIILPIANRGKKIDFGGSEGTVTEGTVTYEDGTSVTTQKNTSVASRIPIKSARDVSKAAYLTPGWHDSTDGRWYQNPDGTYYADGFQEIDGVEYAFDEQGYIRTGWLTIGAKDYYFNEDGSYNPDKQRPMLCLTFDDGPGERTMELLECLEENNAHATFFMLGECVEVYPDAPKKMVEIGCELGNHSWNHPQLTSLSLDAVEQQFEDTDNALTKACGQIATVARAPYGAGNTDIYNTVGKPFFMWSLDSLDWSLMDADKDYDAVMGGDLTDGSIILMHDIHSPSVDAALRLIPDLTAQGYKLVTVSEMAAAKGVDLQYACYTDFWQSSLVGGSVPGYTGGNEGSLLDEINDMVDDGVSSWGSSSDEEIISGSGDSGDDSGYDSEYDTEDSGYDESYEEDYG